MNEVLPNLFIPGAAKSGTTALHTYLSEHPLVFMTREKEPHFFADDELFSRGFPFYCRYFRGAEGALVRGESSTGYMVSPVALERIKKLVADPRFIFVLRNPVDRAWSHFRWLVGLGLETKDFRAAFLSDKDVEPAASPRVRGLPKSYYQYGCYHKWLRAYEGEFERGAAMIVTSESLVSDPLGTVNRCFSFLGLKPLTAITARQENVSESLRFSSLYALLNYLPARLLGRLPYGLRSRWLAAGARVRIRSLIDSWTRGLLARPAPREVMSHSLRAWVADYYRDDVAALREFLSNPLDEWKHDFWR